MRATEIIRQILDIIDAVDQEESSEPVAVLTVAKGTAVAEPEYSNSPQEEIAPLEAAFPAGDDVHYSKNPADIRSDSVSMYPNFQARRQ
jgi:hypothetical protein